MSFDQKLRIDQIEFAKGLASIGKGMQALTFLLVKLGIIKDLWKQWDDNKFTQNARENNYNKRYRLFRAVQFPKMKEYEDFKDSVSGWDELPNNEVFERSKTDIVAGNKVLQNLANTDVKYRNGYFMTTEQLQKIIKVSVMNSLIITQVKMADEEARAKMKCDIDYENSSPYLLLLKIK